MKKYLIIFTIALLSFTSVVKAQEYSFTQNMSVGAMGTEVSALQSWLMTNGYDIPAIRTGIASSGYFGSQTRMALIRYQNASGLPGTGYFGPMTRQRIRDRNPIINYGRSPVINGIDAPTSLGVNQTGIWTVRATDPQNSTLSYSVDWGDVAFASSVCPAGYTCQPSMLAELPRQISTFTHSYSNAGTYTIKFTVQNSAGFSAQSSVTIQVGLTGGAAPLKITTPNGSESWQKGTTQTIRWTSPAYFRATTVDLKLVPYYQPCTGQICPMGVQSSLMYPYIAPYTIINNVSVNQNSYNWTVGNVQSDVQIMIYPPPPASMIVAPDGQYTIQICETGTSNCDSSDRPFTISASSFTPQVISPNGWESWLANSVQTIRWSTYSSSDINTRLDIYLDQTNIYCITTPCGATYVLDRNIPISTIYNWIVATDINNAMIPAGDYNVRICLAGSLTNCDTSDKAFTIRY